MYVKIKKEREIVEVKTKNTTNMSVIKLQNCNPVY